MFRVVILVRVRRFARKNDFSAGVAPLAIRAS